MCFFCNKKTIFLYEFVFFLPKTNLDQKLFLFLHLWLCDENWRPQHKELTVGTFGRRCLARCASQPSIMFVQVFVTFFLRQYVNHRIAGIMMRASWFDCDIVRNILRIAHPLDQKMDVLLSILNGQEMQEGDWIRSEGTTEGRKPFSRQRKARTRSWHEGH